MSCYHPQLLLYEGENPDTGKAIYKFTGTQGVHEHINEKRHPRDILIPCRHCIGCRLDFSRRWADRLMLELDHSKTALFFTLTYDNEHATKAMPFDDGLPDDHPDKTWFYTLVKRDLQLFNKRLRRHFEPREIRFYAAGEYGSVTLRPHIHGIYYGLSLEDFPDLELLFLNVNKQPIYSSKILRDIWQNGHVSIGNVSWQSCAYVARYNLKKLEHGYDDVALARNCIPEFSLMSRNPGIGGHFFTDHPELLSELSDVIYISDPHGVRSVNKVSLPSYLLERIYFLKLINPELYDKIKEERKLASDHKFFAELLNTDLNEYEYLLVKEKNHEDRAKKLIRTL